MIHEPELDRTAIDSFSDARLVALTGDRLAVPRSAAADSFVLHSGLELLARSALLPFVHPESRCTARQRLIDLGDQFEAFSEPVRTSGPAYFDDLAVAAAALVDAIARNELDDVDRIAWWLGSRATPMQLRELLADALVPSLAAAGHASIFLYLLPRVAPRGEVTGQLLRQLSRELCGRPDWRLRWFEGRSECGPADAESVTTALAEIPRLGDPVSTFIHPLMSRIDAADAAGTWLGPSTSGSDLGDRPRAILRVAAWSMITEPTRHAPYGWSHCLTMPQAVLGVADHCRDPSVALAVAATYVAGFRTLADGPMQTQMVAADPDVTVAEAIDAGPLVAAAAAWHRTLTDPRGVVTTLATRAAVHQDAHLVKYTLACMDAAADDEPARPLFMAAAAALAGWWAAAGAGQSP